MDSKTCSKCGNEKPLDDFYRGARHAGGRAPYCKLCDNKIRTINKRKQREAGWVPRRVRIEIAEGMKRCARCHERRPLPEFAIANGHGGYHGYCKPCHAAWAREYARRPDKKEHLHARKRATKFGLTLDEYNALIEAHAGKCAICGGPGGVHGLGIDHRHDETRAVRGLLCSNCNAGIAMFRDDPDWMLQAVAYLRKWDSITAARSSA